MDNDEEKIQHSVNKRGINRSSTPKRRAQSGQSRMDTDFIGTMEAMEDDEERHSGESETTPMDD
eukprot:5407982-Ditylum_brightwellii.AAC.1